MSTVRVASEGFVPFELEHLLSELNATLGNRGIEEGLECVGRHVRADEVFLVPLEGDRSRQTQRWFARGAGREPGFTTSALMERFPWIMSRVREGCLVAFESVEELPAVEAGRDRQELAGVGIEAAMICPVAAAGELLAVLIVGSYRATTWLKECEASLQPVADMFANALARKRDRDELDRARREIRKLKVDAEAESRPVRCEATQLSHGDIIGNSETMRETLAHVEQVAVTDSTVLLLGETGTGKELLAHATHNLSRRRDRAMVTINCAALPPALIEAELFGREKGAYTGALNRQVGRFELADGSTVFLDEVGELPLELQVKLLRVLQEGELERLGSTKTITVDVRVIAATNRNLDDLVRKGEFREDLYYRLNVFPIRVPPLRERYEDVPALVWAFVQEFSERMGKTIERIPKRTMEAFCEHLWPGNVRELRNVIERGMILAKDHILRVSIPASDETNTTRAMTLAEVERRHIVQVLDRTGWRVRGRGGAAEILDVKPTTLESRMEKLGVRRAKTVSEIS